MTAAKFEFVAVSSPGVDAAGDGRHAVEQTGRGHVEGLPPCHRIGLGAVGMGRPALGDDLAGGDVAHDDLAGLGRRIDPGDAISGW
jgi:hypothetical protein